MPFLSEQSKNISGPWYDSLVKQKSFIIVFTLSAIITSIALTYFFSEKYEATTTIMYRPQEMSLLRLKESAAFGAPVPTPPFKVISHTLRKILQSEVILRPVVEELHLDIKEKHTYSSWYQRWYHGAKEYLKDKALKAWMLLKYGRIIEEDPQLKAIETLRKNIDIKVTEDSYAYLLKVKDKYPDRAAKIVDTVGGYLVSWLKNQDQDPAISRYQKLQLQLREKEKEIKKIRKDRENLFKKYKNVSIDEETSSGVDTLYALKQDYDQLNAKVAEKSKKVELLVSEKQRKLKGYIHPDDLKRLESEELFEGVELQSLIAKKKALQASIERLASKLQDLVSLRKEVNNLDMGIDISTREYVHLGDFYMEAFAKASTSNNEIRILYPAVTPDKPVQPIKIYHAGLTAFLGLCVSLGLVYVLAFFEVRIFFKPEEKESQSLLEPRK